MIIGFPRGFPEQNKDFAKYGGAGGIILWALFTVFLVYCCDGGSNINFTIKVCRFQKINGVKYVYCIKHAYKFLLREQVGVAAILWRLRQCVSCYILYACQDTKRNFIIYRPTVIGNMNKHNTICYIFEERKR